MNSFLIKVLLIFLIICKIEVKSEENDTYALSEKVRISYEKWNYLSQTVNRVVHGQSSEEKFPNLISSISIDDMLKIEKHELKEFLNNIGNLISPCSKDLFYVLQSLKKEWSIKMIDSYGKLGSGLLEGNSGWPGSYDECVKIYAPPKPNSTMGNFYGKYCTVTWSLHFSKTSKPLAITTGACIPETCSAAELNRDFALIVYFAGVIPIVKDIFSFVNITSITCKPMSKELNTPAIAMISLISFFGVLVAIGSLITAWEYFEIIRKKYRFNYEQNLLETDVEISKFEKESIINGGQNSSDDVLLFSSSSQESFCSSIFKKSKPFFKCFCAFTNGSKILDTNTGEGQLLCIHGIRFLSMSWVILGHTYAFITNGAIGNPTYTLDSIDSFPFQIVFQGFYSVDSFFVLSGFLLTYLYFKEMTIRDGKISWIYFYAHRYLRLTPVYMIVLGISATLSRYLASGPYAPQTFIDDICEKYWWRNLLYINNLYAPATMCMAWSWYLANDMQFYVISPLFLYTLWRWPKIGFSIIGTFFCTTFICNFVLTYEYDLVPGMSHFSKDMDFLSFMTKFLDFFDKLYIKPYARIGPYLVGVLLGYILFTTKDRRPLSLLVLFFGWIIATLLTLLVIYGLYHTQPNIWVSSLYNAFGRTCFAIGLSWVIYVCLTSGGVVNQILSFKGLIPLSRLTYCAYLVHPIIITAYYQNMKVPIQFSQITMVILFLGLLVISYGVAFITTLLFESPIMGLEKLINKKFKRS